MSFVKNHQIPGRLLECTENTLLLSEINRGNHTMLVGPGIGPRWQIRQHFFRQCCVIENDKLQPELIKHLILPLILESSWYHNQNTISARSGNKLHHNQSGLDG